LRSFLAPLGLGQRITRGKRPAERPIKPTKGGSSAANEFANLLIDVEKKHSPEAASADGLSQYDENISVATHEDDVAENSEKRAVLAKLQSNYERTEQVRPARPWRS